MLVFEEEITVDEEIHNDTEIICMNCGAKTLYVRSSCLLCEFDFEI